MFLIDWDLGFARASRVTSAVEKLLGMRWILRSLSREIKDRLVRPVVRKICYSAY